MAPIEKRVAYRNLRDVVHRFGAEMCGAARRRTALMALRGNGKRRHRAQTLIISR
jgi:hypothetical protein